MHGISDELSSCDQILIDTPSHPQLLCSGAKDGSGGQAEVPSLPDTLSSKTKSDAVDPNKGRLPTAKEGLQQKAGDSR